LETRTRNFYSKPELGVLSCSWLLRSSVWHLGQHTACINIPTRSPRLKNRTALFVQEAGGPRQRMGVFGMRELVHYYSKRCLSVGSVVCNRLIHVNVNSFASLLSVTVNSRHLVRFPKRSPRLGLGFQNMLKRTICLSRRRWMILMILILFDIFFSMEVASYLLL
jgi:hypothetical protein